MCSINRNALYCGSNEMGPPSTGHEEARDHIAGGAAQHCRLVNEGQLIFSYWHDNEFLPPQIELLA